MSDRISIYDEVSFPSYPHALTHPQRLATMARLRGLVSPAIDQCRVLELGCGAGGNLIPMAETLAGSEFVGIDFSEQQVAIAKQHAEAIGLQNIRFLAADLVDLDESLGAFDYIICHGVYSWTTDEGRAAILALCRNHLTAAGISYLNYNTYPGWHVQGMLRDMLRFHSQRFADPAQRVHEARKLIQFLLTELSATNNASMSLLRDELAQVQGYSDSYLFHAYLNVVNQPYYLHQIIERAAAQGLRYVGDSDARAMWPEGFSGQTVEAIRAMAGSDQSTELATAAGSGTQVIDSDAITEQYHDFVRFGMSRRSLFCRKEATPRAVHLREVLADLHVSAHLHVQDATLQRSIGTTFTTAGRQSFTVQDQRLELVLRLLASRWPQSQPWWDLHSAVEQQWNQTENSTATGEEWLMDLFRLFVRDIVELSVRPSIAAREISEQPRASALARRQAASPGLITNLRHQAVNLKELDREVLQFLDGRHSEQDIANALSQSLELVHQSLTRLAKRSLLVSS